MTKFSFDVSSFRSEFNIHFVRLKNGDDIISYVMEESDGTKPVVRDKIYLVSPAKIRYMDEQRGLQVMLLEWVPSKVSPDEAFEVYIEDILTMGDVNPLLKGYYTKFIAIVDKANATMRKMITYDKEAAMANDAQTSASLVHAEPYESFVNPHFTDKEIEDKIVSTNYHHPNLNKRRWVN